MKIDKHHVVSRLNVKISIKKLSCIKLISNTYKLVETDRMKEREIE